MLIHGNDGLSRRKKLVCEAAKLINSGVDPEKILIICQNSHKKLEVIKLIENEIAEKGKKPEIRTFTGICHNAVLNRFDFIIKNHGIQNPKETPNLCGLSLSEAFLKKSIVKGFEDYFSKTSLMHQLFRRRALIVNNALNDEDVKKRSTALSETFADAAARSLKKFEEMTFMYQSFDYISQVKLFREIYENTDIYAGTEYLFVDDADEMTFAQYKFIEFLQPRLKRSFIAFDKNGSSRLGYLCACKNLDFSFGKQKEKYRFDLTDTPASEAERMFKEILSGNVPETKAIRVTKTMFRPESAEKIVKKIKELTKESKASDIFVATPILDELTVNSLKNSGLKIKILDGSEKLKDNPSVFSILTILRMIYPCKKPDKNRLRQLFHTVLKIPAVSSFSAVDKIFEAGKFVPVEFKNERYNGRYKDFSGFVNTLRPTKLSDNINRIFEYLKTEKPSKKDVIQLGFFIKEIKSFENVSELSAEAQSRIITQFENDIISENPSYTEEIPDDALIVGTPQKIIDCGIRRKYGIWADVSSELWNLRDCGPLYNAPVFSAQREPAPYDFEENKSFEREKTARVLRKLMLCSSEQIYTYESVYDISGTENFGILPSLFVPEPDEIPPAPKKFIPRNDQKPVIEYNGGYTGVNAVPGAGKTAVLTALTLKLIENGTKPSEIFIVTYMDSAAETIKERIRAALSQTSELPAISTIHGLAMRIIKENNNFALLNLTEDFSICDDTTRQKVMTELISKLGLDYEDYDDYERATSKIKLSAGKIKRKYTRELNKFYEFFDGYEKILRTSDMIDYDDMLKYAVKLLEKYPQIRKYYANLCKYAIEDEAQDSSELQQRLLRLISSKHKNLLRCGDVNQAITASFTASEPEKFKSFFTKNEKAEMTTSGRNAKEIQNLANRLISATLNDDFLKNSFHPVEMTPADTNPQPFERPEFHVFTGKLDEKIYIVSKIKRILKTDEKASIAILLRNNRQVEEYYDFLTREGFSVITKSDLLGQNPVFRVILSFIKFYAEPESNARVKEIIKVFKETNIRRFSDEDDEYMKGLKEPFLTINPDLLPSSALLNLWWDLNFSADENFASADTLAANITEKFFMADADKTDGYIITTLIKRICNLYSTTETIIQRLEYIANRPLNFGVSRERADISQIKLMTVHKSKGDEFDAVFMPEFSEENYPSEEKKIKLKSKFLREVDELDESSVHKSEQDMKREIAEETLRLVYVGITRAKRALYLTCTKKFRSEPSKILKNLSG